ncbi:GAF domain-containing protein [Streptomyces puniciscabiei]
MTWPFPLITRDEVIGVMGLARARTPQPFDEDDLALACEMASTAAPSIDNAVLHQHIRKSAETLQRSLLPQLPPRHPRLEVASRYRPAQAITAGMPAASQPGCPGVLV